MTSVPQMPDFIAQGPGGDPGVEMLRMLLKERIVMLGSEVSDDSANAIIAQMLYLEGQDPDRDIWLYINSPGGSVTAGLGASMGQFLLCAGAQGKRYALPHARIMMHQPLGGIQGQAADIAIQAEQMKYIKKLMAERIAFHTGQSVEQVETDSERDRWFTAEQAKDYGIIDSVIVRRGELL